MVEFAPPLIVWAIVIIGLLTVCASNGFNPFSASTWARWDSGHYLFIAAHGYDLFPCPAVLHGFRYPPGTWCGHAGWFPAYPWLIGALHAFGFSFEATATAVSWLFALGTLLLLWATFLRRRSTAAAIGCLIFAAYVPGQIYDYAIFPLSMLAFFTVLHLWLLNCRHWLLAGLAGGVAAMTHPIGLMLAPVSALWILLFLRDAPGVERLRRVALTSVVTAAGFGIVMLDMKLETGAWDAYFKIQAKSQTGFNDPFAAFRSVIHPALHGSLLHVTVAPAVQTLFLGIVVVCIAVEAVWHWRGLAAVDWLLLLWALFFFLFPLARLTQAHLGLVRYQAALLPLGLLLLRLPRPMIILFAGAALWVSVPIAQLFLTGVLV